MSKTIRQVVAAALLVLGTGSAARALEPEQIVLIVNSRVPASRQLAEFYAEQRKIPAAQILALEFPFPAEDITPAIYERRIKPKVREFLEKNDLKDKVTCVVTFYGVPIRITRRDNTAAERAEALKLETELSGVLGQVESAVAEVERLAKQLDPSFVPKIEADAQPAAGNQPAKPAKDAPKGSEPAAAEKGSGKATAEKPPAEKAPENVVEK